MAQEVKTARTPAVFELQQASLRNRFGDAAYQFVEATSSGFKWPTLAAIDSAVEDGDLTAEEEAAASSGASSRRPASLRTGSATRARPHPRDRNEKIRERVTEIGRRPTDRTPSRRALHAS
ncbi:hypothetical protein CNMCM5623_002869 [Aspergillus felis]|uniref:Uncharacterized protein n=1 Tax=Aspergillus felis TaxID=1287682 RepID=A0A8H6UY18_9EURO|nr:hypothetical protein CNMCM5623_002869 [Aspergillus felis]